MLDLISAMFAAPEAQRGPYEWAAVAMAHAWIGAGAALLASMLIGGRFGSVTAAVLYAALWELPQARASGLWADSALDAAMWGLGCVFAAQARSVRAPAAVWCASLVAVWAGVGVRS